MYVGLKQPPGDGERYVTPARAAAKETTTLVELLISPAYDKAEVEAYNERLGQLRNLRDACRARIDWRMEILEKVGSQYSDVYVSNQTACISDRGYHLKMYDVQTDSRTSFL